MPDANEHSALYALFSYVQEDKLTDTQHEVYIDAHQPRCSNDSEVNDIVDKRPALGQIEIKRQNLCKNVLRASNINDDVDGVESAPKIISIGDTLELSRSQETKND